MGHKFADIAFTETVKNIQVQQGSRAGYQGMQQGPDYNDCLGTREAAFIAERDSFYMATVSETDWPYIQHRGGPAGFVKIIDNKTIGFADFSGNRQYVSTGNLQNNDRISLFFMDYPNKARLKMLGRVKIIGLDQPELMRQLELDDYRAPVERGFLIEVEAFDWNCPKYITPRYSQQQLQPILDENAQLKAQLAERAESVLGIASSEQAIGSGSLPLVIRGIRQLTDSIRSYELAAVDGQPLPMISAGAHLSVPVQLPDGEWITRQYSISSDPNRRDHYEITVQRDEQGQGGSRALHQQYQLGMTINCGLPRNHFALSNGDKPVLLIAGGIGITPLRAMIYTLQQQARDVTLHYAAASQKQMAFYTELTTSLGEKIVTYFSVNKQRMDLVALLDAHRDHQIYACGPGRLLDELLAVAETLEFPVDQIRLERFAMHLREDDQPIEVTLAKSGRTLQVAEDQTVLEALQEAEVTVPYSCKAGNCRSCVIEVVEGEPDHRDTALSPAERASGLFTCCVSRAKNGHLTLDL